MGQHGGGKGGQVKGKEGDELGPVGSGGKGQVSSWLGERVNTAGE